MEMAAAHSSLADILHAISQGLLIPDIILLIAFAGYALFCIGSILVEFFTERRNFKAQMPRFLAALMGADEQDIPEVITESGLLNRQKIALLTVFDYRMLPGDALVALIRRTVDVEETRYDRITGRNNTAAKVAPMLGLMGTLIPLGPGVAALADANTEMLSSSLLVAFDTTVAGLVVAAVCLVVGKIRSNWYGDYLSSLDSAMATMLQKIENMREEGAITVQEPTDYAFMYEESIAKEKARGSKNSDAAAAAEMAEEVAAEAGMAGGAIELPGVQGGPLATTQAPGELATRIEPFGASVAGAASMMGEAAEAETAADEATKITFGQATEDIFGQADEVAEAAFEQADENDAEQAAEAAEDIADEAAEAVEAEQDAPASEE